jgi:hypothetical protein
MINLYPLNQVSDVSSQIYLAYASISHYTFASMFYANVSGLIYTFFIVKNSVAIHLQATYLQYQGNNFNFEFLELI